jgi:predicted flap endonuclease-1-like 5' DNA nuclease
MDDLRAFLRDAGALVLSPLLVPGVRPLTKAALKGGMAVADVAKEAAESTGKQLREAVTDAREGLKKAPQPVAAEPTQADAPQAADGVAAAAAESGLRPMAAAALKGAQSLLESTASFVSETGKQWSDIIADASAERKGGAAETPQAEAPTTSQAEATEVAAAAPAAAAPAAAATEAAQAAASAAGETADSVARGLRPIVKSIMKGGMAFAESASDVASQASKQWSGIFADASVKQRAGQMSDAAEAAQAPVEAPVVAAPVAAAAPEVVTAAAPGTAHEADDLTQVNGIGPKAAALLNEAGITTFAQLAALSTDQLRGILSKGGPRYRIIDPTPWPADARRLMESVPAASVVIRDDDLVQVNGIGPKVAALLNEAGITTLTQLAATSTDQLRAILTKAGPRYRIVDPTPWPAEARRLLETPNS